MKLLTLLFAVLTALPATAQSDRILLPLVVDTPVAGGHQSLWRTDLVVRNEGPHDVWISVGCEGVCGPAILRPGESLINPPIPGLPRGAAFLYGPPERLDQIQVSLRVRDLSRQAESHGTELPIVRLEEASRQRLTFLDIPASSEFRRALRLYSSSTTAIPVTIRVSDLDTPAEPLLELSATIEPSSHKPFQYPAYAEIMSDGELEGAERLLIEVATDSDDAIWGFVSITSNLSQQVTIATPR